MKFTLTLLTLCCLAQVALADYIPSLGRFCQRDPIEESGGVNLYAFAGNNSLNSWDRLGLEFYVAIVPASYEVGKGFTGSAAKYYYIKGQKVAANSKQKASEYKDFLQGLTDKEFEIITSGGISVSWALYSTQKVNGMKADGITVCRVLTFRLV